MSTAADASTAAAAAPRLWGSALLLRKVPLYAQARQYAAVDPDEPQSEGNTLGYGVSTYPLLAAVRTTYNAVNSDATTEGPATSRDTRDVVDRSAFCGIHQAGYAHVPAQRKWMSTSTLAAGVAASTTTSSVAIVRRAAAAAVLDDALGPPTLAQVLEPWFGVLEDHLTVDAQERHDAAVEHAASTKHMDNKKRETSTSQGEENDAVQERVIDPDVQRCQRRKRLYEREAETRGAVYTRLEGALMHYSAATTEEKDILRSVRASSNSNGSSGGGGEVSAAEAQLALSPARAPPETWGARMLSLVTSAAANERGPINDEKVEQQQKVLAYLKRVRWIATQWSGARDPSALKDAAAVPSWGQLTEAMRVQAEMTHTQGQRRRFRRTRRGPAGDANNADEGDAVDE
ncbi:hypothetical protein ABB37_02376 [Leptomonas pyrrhocoris]|uniref:Uncharacterized protein n=1 Tax=Leptomonas pyrrhocoris TaxID=157538 RepID=A0A0N0DYR8_LEPPY|nr:hypothetical protein ABB37_02376 [Leptomonas pyrrhocoris]XP_015662831.1 hypothetical protein ABB37_02376 [Leptomonas pyrrhocoris]KPA84391.1 hypothetical protein ABB37_02376 [Leptomonas pyrrhocoris]KPA84392.1 hypothetical protein ABB37_02376 [Leptomonas pyrrhocoris]|eukprot:XP_015662830.1 hypothetical protein ABB37_02376 [Leptomonas pyrrhocoris]